MSTASAMLSKIASVKKSLPQQVARALYREANIELTEAKKRTPIAPAGTPGAGNLRASGYVTEPVINGDSISIKIGFGGGPSSAYAVAVHEHLSEHSPSSWQGNEDINWNSPGTGPKFLESTLLESRPFMAQRIARRVSLKNK